MPSSQNDLVGAGIAEWSRPMALAGAFVALLASAAAHLDLMNGEGHPYGPEYAFWVATGAAAAAMAVTFALGRWRASPWVLAGLGPVCALSMNIGGFAAGGLLVTAAALHQVPGGADRAGRVLAVAGGVACMALGVLLWYPYGHDWLGVAGEYGPPAPASAAGPLLFALGAATASSALPDGRWTGVVPLVTAVATVALLGWRWTYLAPHQILPPLLLLASAAALRFDHPAKPAPVRPSQPS